MRFTKSDASVDQLRCPRDNEQRLAILLDLGVLMRLAGIFAAATGIAGWCPAYSAAGVTSLGGPGDRPDESERVGWLAASAGVATVPGERSADGDAA